MDQFFVIQNTITKEYYCTGRDGVQWDANVSEANRYVSAEAAKDDLKRVADPYDYSKIAGRTMEIKELVKFGD